MRKVFSFVTVLALGVCASSIAMAQYGVGQVYGRIDGGAFLIHDIDFNASASAAGVTVNAQGAFEFSPGVAVSGALGYRISNFLSAEIDLGYARSEYDQITGTLTVTSGGTNFVVSGSADVEGQVTMFSGMGNLIWTPNPAGKFRPHFGAGIGLVRVTDEIDRVGTLVVNGEKTETEFAANFIAGFDYQVAPAFTLGARYRFYWVNSGEAGVDDATASAIMATATFKF